MRKFVGFGLTFACFFSLSGVCAAMGGGGLYNYIDTLLDQNGDEILVSPVRVSPLTKDDPWIQRVFSADPQERDFVTMRPSWGVFDNSDDLEKISSSPNKIDEAITDIEYIACNSSSPALVAWAQELLDYAEYIDRPKNSSTQYLSPVEVAVHQASQRDDFLFAAEMLEHDFLILQNSAACGCTQVPDEY